MRAAVMAAAAASALAGRPLCGSAFGAAVPPACWHSNETKCAAEADAPSGPPRQPKIPPVPRAPIFAKWVSSTSTVKNLCQLCCEVVGLAVLRCKLIELEVLPPALKVGKVVLGLVSLTPKVCVCV